MEAAKPKVEPSPRAEDEDPSPSPPIEDMGWCMEDAEAKPPAGRYDYFSVKHLRRFGARSRRNEFSQKTWNVR